MSRPARLDDAAWARVLALSPFVAGEARRDEAGLRAALDAPRQHEGEGYGERYARRLSDALDGAAGEAEFSRRLRLFRNREMACIALRDLSGRADLDETLADLSGLADACIAATHDFLHRALTERYAAPPTFPGLIILGMGKLGGGELNFSSDIDLIFAYREDGTLTDARATSHEEFFTRLAQGLVRMLSALTAEGFVFRVDTRLRPFGESGPLVMSLAALETYYQAQAREWERYAMVKARAVAGDLAGGAELLRLLRPFVYRRYLDYRAFGALRELKHKIHQDLTRRGAADSLKLGSGGIREIEFIAQAFQLIRGGQDPELRDRRIRPVLAALGRKRLLPAEDATALLSAYAFLRRAENRVQAREDRQTHDIPQTPDAQVALAQAMGYPDWAAFSIELDRVRETVHTQFRQVIARQEGAPPDAAGTQLWARQGEGEALDELWIQMGYAEPAAAQHALDEFRASPALRRLSARGVEEMDRLIPRLLRAAAPEPLAALTRTFGFLEAVATRNVYYTLLAENPGALAQLVRLNGASPWIARCIARQPSLLDELLDTRQLYAPLDIQALRTALTHALAGCNAEDEEATLDALRRFKQAQVLRVAACDIMGVLPLMVVSDHLTAIAETVLTHALDLAWQRMVTRHGVPPGCGTALAESGFAVIAYGKLGGIELGYGSDLDLVFVHRDVDPATVTSGPQPLGVVPFYARLAQRLVHNLTAQLPTGSLYDVDLRLRPNGASGLPATPIAALRIYHEESAWTWERQALIRARAVTGDAQVATAFSRIRVQSLSRPRDETTLRHEVREMREKMRQTLAHHTPGVFDLKQGEGGIADIEFLVQFGVLARAARQPDVLEFTDNMRQIERLAIGGFFTTDEAETLRRAYCAFRAQAHRAALDERPATALDNDGDHALRETVRVLWHAIMERPDSPPQTTQDPNHDDG